MAGAGYKTFTAGEVLTASDVNTYLMQQSVQNYGGTAARSSAIPTPSTGMVSYIGTTGTATIPQLEVYTGSAWQTPYGLTEVANVSFTAASNVTIDYAFTANFDNYKIELNMTTAANTAFNLLLRKSGADLTGTDYCCTYYYSALRSASTGTVYSGLTTSVLLHQSNVCRAVSGTYELLQPFSTTFTQGAFSTIQMDAAPTTPYSFMGGFADLTARSADGIKLSVPSSTMTGSVRIYGYRNS